MNRSADQHDRPKYVVLILKKNMKHFTLSFVHENWINVRPLSVLARHFPSKHNILNLWSQFSCMCLYSISLLYGQTAKGRITQGQDCADWGVWGPKLRSKKCEKHTVFNFFWGGAKTSVSMALHKVIE
jgi:hypothetical protein